MRVHDLSTRLDVSANTIRNDLNAMAGENLLHRVRGGATISARNGGYKNRVFAARAGLNRAAKERIGRWAAGLVNDGDALVLDASSTVYYLATFLADRQDLTVVTNGFETALLLAQNPSHKVILAANVIQPGGCSTVVGSIHPDLLNRFYASKCFLSCAGLSAGQGLAEADVDEAPLKADMLKLARHVIALVDSSKIGRINTYRFAELDQIDHLITDEAAPSEALAELQAAADFSITLVGPSGVETRLAEPSPLQKQRYRIGFGNMTEKMVFAQQVRRSLELAARRLDNVELLIRDNQMDRQAGLDNADWFVTSGVDLVIEYQIDARAGNVIMDKFNQARIPVIAVDIPLPGATFFGADNYRAGYIAGEALGNWIQNHWQGRLDVLLKLKSDRVGPVSEARLQGQQEGLEAVIGPLTEDRTMAFDSPVIVGESESVIAGLLHTFSRQAHIAIITINDDAALGALAAFEKAGRLDQVVAVGQNADQLGLAALRRRRYPFIGSTRYAPETYGEKLLELALNILEGKPVPPAVYNQHVFITADNVSDYYPELVDTILHGGDPPG